MKINIIEITVPRDTLCECGHRNSYHWDSLSCLNLDCDCDSFVPDFSHDYTEIRKRQLAYIRVGQDAVRFADRFLQGEMSQEDYVRFFRVTRVMQSYHERLSLHNTEGLVTKHQHLIARVINRLHNKYRGTN